MMRAACGPLTLADVRTAGTPTLRVECLCCFRSGRYDLARLIATHGATAPLERLKYTFARTCPHIFAASIYDRCGVYYPDALQIIQTKGKGPL
jgi:hypothetical protein